MELDEDNHLCLRCSKTINGLNNYVLHRQQQCGQFNSTPTSSPFLSDSSKALPVSESQDLNTTDPQDIYRLSASDFFLSLNLQSIACDSEKCLTNINENFPNRMDLPSLENELASPLAKTVMCSNMIEEENGFINGGNIDISNEKWDYNFKLDTSDNNVEQNSSQNRTETTFVTAENLMLELESEYNVNNLCDVSGNLQSQLIKEGTKQETLTKKIIDNSNTSQEPKCAFDKKPCHTFCCIKSEHFICSLCGDKYVFLPNFLIHLLSCKQQLNNFEHWKSRIFNNSNLFTCSLPFKCDLCSFYCNDSIAFLDHLKCSNHIKNAASSNSSLICLPCQEECLASDEIMEHFFKNHLQNENILHPIIITEMKKNSHCCFCLFLVKRIINLNLKSKDVIKCDIVYMKRAFPVLILCAMGIAKSLLNSVIKTINQLLDFIEKPESKELNKETKSVEDSNLESISNRNNLSNSTPNAEPDLTNGSSPTIQFNAQTKLHTNGETTVHRKRSHKSFKNVVKILMKEGNKIKRNACINAKSKHIPPKYESPFSKMPSLQKQSKLHNTNKKSQHLNSPTSDCFHKNKIQMNTYLCDECGYAGKTVHHLTKHKRSHTGEKPFKCTHCSYSCSLSSQLLRHKRLHSGSKPYKCPYCSYTCNTQENLRKHVLKTKKHQGKKLYPCQHCSFECNIFSAYKEHLLQFHAEHFPNKDKDIISSAVAGIYDVSQVNKN
ncbi:zinc finger protein 271-like [Uloborus diversus]|uniref:zinc finger protein 271-like n=1 Tax=Uloborus diversus TaxID=327109 RepID=UPI0024093368|nr:zinc finger protein 271-like [Uloborus diversus]